MADLYGKNATLIAAGKKVPPGEYNGRAHSSYDEYTFAADVIAIAKTVSLGKIPKGAKVKNVIVMCASLGTTGIFKLGYAATAADASDRTADLGSGYDAGGQVVDTNKNLLSAALAEEKEVIATFTEATDSANGDKLRVLIEYVIN